MPRTKKSSTQRKSQPKSSRIAEELPMMESETAGMGRAGGRRTTKAAGTAARVGGAKRGTSARKTSTATKRGGAAGGRARGRTSTTGAASRGRGKTTGAKKSTSRGGRRSKKSE